MSNDKLSKAIDSLRQYRDRKPLYLHTKTPKQVRDELATRDRLIEQLGEALEKAHLPWGGYNVDDALAAYREWKEGKDGHKG